MPRRKNDKETEAPELVFIGFEEPTSNWFKMPQNWTDITADITNLAELKVVEYILRHTWGYQEYGIKKHITIDEFVSGRRRRDGSRLDNGTGLSERAVRYGLQNALKGGLIEEEIDDTDLGRVKKYYSLKMKTNTLQTEAEQYLQPGVQTLHPDMQDLPVRGAESTPRTEKETLERNFKKASNTRKTNTSYSEKKEDPKVTQLATSAHAQEGFVEINTILTRTKRSPKREANDQDRQVILEYIVDFAGEFNDQASLKSSTTRAYNLFKRSGVGLSVFTQAMYAARATVKDRSASIRSTSKDPQKPVPTKHKMAYWFSCLEDVLGLREEEFDSQNANNQIPRSP